MKTLAVLILLLSTSTVDAEEPLPGIYRGYITIARTNKALRLNDVVTLIIVGEIYSTSPGGSHIAWTATNLDQSSRLNNSWADFAVDYSTYQNEVPDIGISGNILTFLSGGKTVPGSFRMTSKSLAWKCVKQGNAPYPRDITITTTFSISRTGPSPPPDANP